MDHGLSVRVGNGDPNEIEASSGGRGGMNTFQTDCSYPNYVCELMAYISP